MSQSTPTGNRAIPCDCAKERMATLRFERLLQACELPPRCQRMTFASWEDRDREAYNAAVNLANGTSPQNWLTFMGRVDRGKSHLAAAICHAWIARGQAALYGYVPDLLDEIKRGFRDEKEDSATRFDRIRTVPLLVMDDIGAEHRTGWASETLERIIEYRLMRDLALVVTTNLTLDELPPRIASRLDRNGRIVFMEGTPYHA